MKIKYPKPKTRARRPSPDNGESEGDRALRRMVDPHHRLPFWFDFDGISEEDFLGYTPGDQ